MHEKIDNIEFRIQIAAYLYSRCGDQKEVASQLRISQSQVSRLIKQAIDRGLLIRRFEFNKETVSKKRFDEIRSFEIPGELIKQLGKVSDCLNDVRVYESGNSHDSYSNRLIPFAHNASNYLQDLLAEINIVGVTWGNTLSSLVDALEKKYSYTEYRDKKIFVPLCAELIGVASEQYHSTMIADRLNEIVNKRKAEHLSLSGVPAFIPKHSNGRILKKEEFQFLWEIVNYSNNYRNIFKGDESFVNKLDCILTSIGPINEPFGPSIVEVEQFFSFEEIKSEVIGDIGGVLLKKKNYMQNHQSLFIDLEEMWTGIQFDKIKELTEESAKFKKCGVVVFAHGKNKAPVLLEAIRQRLVNKIVIDFELSKELMKLIKQESKLEGD